MGVYVYQVIKGKKAALDGKTVEVGVLKYFCKPYWDVWHVVLNGGKIHFGVFEKAIAKTYRMFFARQNKIPYRKYVVYKFEQGEYVYEMAENTTWSYDTPTIGTGAIGSLNCFCGYWWIDKIKKESV